MESQFPKRLVLTEDFGAEAFYSDLVRIGNLFTNIHKVNKFFGLIRNIRPLFPGLISLLRKTS